MNFRLTKNSLIIFCFLAAIFGLYLFLVWQPADRLLTNFLADDAFYYFKTAANIVHGLGPTFDGENLTNGYHPLWMGINALVYYFLPNNKILPIHLILSLAVLLYFGTTLLLWKIIGGWINSRLVQGILVSAYALNPWNASIYLNGLETPLALFLLVLLFFLFFKILKNPNPKPARFFILGIIAGLVILARLDYGLFVGAIFFYFLWKIKKTGWRSLLVFTVPAAIIASPWFLYNYFYFGSFIPASGLAYTLINHRLWFYKPRTLFQILLWSIYNFFGTIAFTLKTVGIPVFFSGWYILRSAFSLGVIFAILFLIAAYFYFFKRERWKAFGRRLLHSAEGRSWLVFGLAYLVLVIVHGAIRWSGREWYFASFQILTLIFISLALSEFTSAYYQKLAAGILGILMAISFSGSWKNFFPQNPNQLEMYQVALWLKNNLPADARIAAFNSGIYGYFSDHFLMDSDGLINNAAFKAMSENQLWNFFKKEKIDYLVDYEITLTYRYKSFLGIGDPLGRLQKLSLPANIDQSGNYGGTHVNLYKLL